MNKKKDGLNEQIETVNKKYPLAMKIMASEGLHEELQYLSSGMLLSTMNNDESDLNISWTCQILGHDSRLQS